MSDKTCLNCSAPLHGNYCSNCGEKVYGAHDKNLAHLFEEAFHFLTHFEGKFLTTLKTIFLRPGKLSLDYCQGLRKKYFKPASFYFLLVVLYLIFPIARGLNLPLQNFKYAQGQSIVSATISNKMTERHLSHEELAARYEQKSEKLSKFLLIIILPLCALLINLVFLKRSVLFFDCFILSAEINAMFLMTIFMLVPLMALPFGLMMKPSPAAVQTIDLIMSILALSLIVGFSAVAFRRFFEIPLLKSALLATLFGLGQMFIVFFIYRFTLFFLVMALI